MFNVGNLKEVLYCISQNLFLYNTNIFIKLNLQYRLTSTIYQIHRTIKKAFKNVLCEVFKPLLIFLIFNSSCFLS